MKDKYFIKKEKVANLLFDLVKYLLTTLGAMWLLSEKPLRLPIIFTSGLIALAIFIVAFIITPLKED